MNIDFRPLAGRRGLILGPDDEQGIAWGCARRASALGARLVLACVNERAAATLAPLAARANVSLLTFDVERRGSLEAMVDAAALQLGGFDFVVHSIAWAPGTGLRGCITDSDVEGVLRAMRESCHSLTRIALLCGPRMLDGGALVTISPGPAEVTVAHHNLGRRANAALESIVRYLAIKLEPWRIRVHVVSRGPAPSSNSAPYALAATHDDIADSVVSLVGAKAGDMNGRMLFVDGSPPALRGALGGEIRRRQGPASRADGGLELRPASAWRLAERTS